MTEQDEELLADLLLRWEELRERGQDAPANDLCREQPHLTEELDRRINALMVTSWLDKPIPDQVDLPITSSLRGESRTLIGRYRVDRLIAEGGYAQVWKGFDLELQRAVAVKIPKSNRLDSDEAFMAEARRVARLKHPGIVPVFDVGRDDKSCFIISDFVEGGSLGDHLANTPPTQQNAIRWVAEVAEALEYAHANGVIHRDIKPANILIDHHGRALLADFGIAESVWKAGINTPSAGTLRYMAPEQLTGKGADGRSDTYGLGVVLHELLTGRLPYSSDDPNTLRREIVAGATVGGMPAELGRICTKALRHDPTDRYLSAGQMAVDLRQVLSRPSKRWAVIGTIMAVILVSFATVIWWPNTRIIPEQPITKSDDEWMAEVSTLPANEQVRAVADKLRERNPGFDGDVKSVIDGGVVVGLEFITDAVSDISAVRALPGLKSLICCGTWTGQSNGRLSNLSPLNGMALTKLELHYNGRLTDLTPLAGMPLTHLHLGRTNVADLSPLRDMPLHHLSLGSTPVTDLSPLQSLKLKVFACDHTGVVDLTPLAGMPLERVYCHDTPIKSLGPLRGMPLYGLECHRTEVGDLSPLKGMTRLYGLNILSTKVTDLSPLKEMPGLRLLWCDFVARRDGDVLREVKSLEWINDKPVAEFWKGVIRR